MLLYIWRYLKNKGDLAKLENKDVLGNYISNNVLDIEKMISEYSSYLYLIVKNMGSIAILDEDIEEIISDVFLAIWKNSENLNRHTNIKEYLTGIAKNVTRNKYRSTELNYSISDYEEKLFDNLNIEKLSEEKEQDRIIKKALKNLSDEEYNVFIMFYYNGKKVKEIAELLHLSESNVKVKLHRIRKLIKKDLKNGGYGYDQ